MKPLFAAAFFFLLFTSLSAQVRSYGPAPGGVAALEAAGATIIPKPDIAPDPVVPGPVVARQSDAPAPAGAPRLEFAGGL